VKETKRASSSSSSSSSNSNLKGKGKPKGQPRTRVKRPQRPKVEREPLSIPSNKGWYMNPPSSPRFY
jgi:hypothetical protein